jgi:hypothetical protein
MLLLRLGNVAETSKETTISTTSQTFVLVEKNVSLEKQCVKSSESIQPQVARGPEAAPRRQKSSCEVRKERGQLGQSAEGAWPTVICASSLGARVTRDPETNQKAQPKHPSPKWLELLVPDCVFRPKNALAACARGSVRRIIRTFSPSSLFHFHA